MAVNGLARIWSAIRAGGAPRVALISWRPPDGTRNFGDELSRVIVAAMASRYAIDPQGAARASKRLLAVGSIVDWARSGDVVWGTGMRGMDILPRRGVRPDIRAVRGPLTASALRARGLAVPSIFGDPALLLPRLFPGRFQPAAADADYVVIPHFADLSRLPPDERILSPLSPWEQCVERIAGAGFVISGSLHGIVVAEAFGVPARYLRLSDFEPQFKYDDHAQATGRDRLVPAVSVEDALTKGPDVPARIDTAALEAAFPADLWQAGPQSPV